MKHSDLLDVLFGLPLFAGTDRQVLSDTIREHARIENFSSGQSIAAPSDTKKRLGVMLEGSASVFSAEDNGGALLRMLTKGDTFGVANLFSTQDRFVSLIVAKKPCTVLFFSGEAAEAMLRDDPVFRLNYVRFLSDRICFLNTKISCFTAGTPERRLAVFLLTLGETEPEQFSISLCANSLSEMLNVGRASLYRAFEKLEAEGLIARDGKTITVLDKSTLQKRFR